MILQIRIGETITVMMDDEITDSRPVPEQVDDYLARIRRHAVQCYVDLPESKAVPATEDDG